VNSSTDLLAVQDVAMAAEFSPLAPWKAKESGGETLNDEVLAGR
jgi:hypothetical protein